MKKTNLKSIFYPDYIAASVLEISIEELQKINITHLVFDIDEPVVPKRHNKLTDEYIEFLQHLEEKEFILLIGSNTRRDLSEITQHIKSRVVKPSHLSFKPLKKYYQKIIDATGTTPDHIAMVGDKLLNDVIGANYAGLTSILVEPYARQQKIHHRVYFKRALRKS